MPTLQLMKKFLAILIVNLIFSTSSHAITMKGLDEVEILIEDMNKESQDVCNLYQRDITTSLEYIISNSNIKIRSGKNLKIPILYVAGGIHHNKTLCSGSVILELWYASIDDPMKKENLGKFVYFDRNAFMSANHSEFKKHYLSFLETLAKEFVIEWNKSN